MLKRQGAANPQRAPPTLVELLDPAIGAAIADLETTEFHPDPIAGKNFSRIKGVMTSACIKHGNIIERTLLEHLKSRPELTMWSDKQFQVSRHADDIVRPVG